MEDNNMLNYIKKVVKHMPQGWLNITTHRLDIYNEALAKTEFLAQFDQLYKSKTATPEALAALPTAYDYIRLGHPLSCVLEWAMAQWYTCSPSHVISFSSKSMPILAILRKNLFAHKKTQLVYTDTLPDFFDADLLRHVYGYQFELNRVDDPAVIPAFEGSTILISSPTTIQPQSLLPTVDFYVNIYGDLGSVLLVNGAKNSAYISEIQHVRRRESIAMTPANARVALQLLINQAPLSSLAADTTMKANKSKVLASIKEITASPTTPLVGSSGLSIQYAIMMGLIDHAATHHPGKSIKFIVPPNCYGGTNDQARRVAACSKNVTVVDLPVDGDNDMVESIDRILTNTAKEDAIPYIIAEIPTNPRVEVPDLNKLNEVLQAVRKTPTGTTAIDPVFILDQTFCPNVLFLAADAILATVRTISYASGSKFPSGGLCTAGYCVEIRAPKT